MARLLWMSLGAVMLTLAACENPPGRGGQVGCGSGLVCIDPAPEIQLSGTLVLTGPDVMLREENDLVRLINVRGDIAQQLEGEEVVATGRWQHADFFVTDLRKNVQAPQKPDSLLLRRG